MDRLKLLAISYQHNLDIVFRQASNDVRALSADSNVAGNALDMIESFDPALPDYASIFASFGGEPEARIEIDNTQRPTVYGRRHLRLHEPVRRLLKDSDYADVLLLDRDGRIVYTARKDADFGRSTGDATLASTGLARLRTRLERAGGTAVQFEDFGAYPVGDGPSAFLGIPILRRANVAMGTAQQVVRVGYLVLRIGEGLVDHALMPRTGLGTTGQVLVLGADLRVRNDPTPARTALAETLRPPLVSEAGGNTAGGGLAQDEAAGILRATASVGILGTRWTILVAQDEAEATGGTFDLLFKLLLSGAVVGGLAVALALHAATRLVEPLTALTRSLQQLAGREWLPEIPGSHRSDEIGAIARAVADIRDLTAETAKAEAQRYRSLSEENQRLANLDSLTQLANRRGFLARLAAAEAAGGRRSLFLMIMDLDGFKPVNDAFGHSAGDHVLRSVADRLKQSLGPDAVLGRLGGDEFACLLDGGTEADAVLMADLVVSAVRQDIVLPGGDTVRVGISIGIAGKSDETVTLERLLERADVALYAAKASGKGTSTVYAPALEEGPHGPRSSDHDRGRLTLAA